MQIVVYLFIVLLTFVESAQATPSLRMKWLAQGWSENTRSKFYSISQGSQLMPYRWFLALETPQGDKPFKDILTTSYGFIPRKRSKDNPDALPIGMVKDQDPSGEWIGINCAACHTALIRYGDSRIVVDGSSATHDAYRFIQDVNKALQATRTDPGRFSRFARKVLAIKWSKQRKAELLRALGKHVREFDTFAETVQTAPSWGAGRIDAFGVILNRIGVIGLKDPRNGASPDAPVNYPHIWGTHTHDFAQWNAAVPSGTFWTALGRNVGQVLGSYGKLRADLTSNSLGIPSTVRRSELVRIERWIKSLRSPRWPEQIFGAIDETQRARGEEIYRVHCLSCHTLLDSNSNNAPQQVKRIPISEVKTDPMMEMNFRSRFLYTGILQGVRPAYSSEFFPYEPAESVLSKVVAGVVAGTLLRMPMPVEPTRRDFTPQTNPATGRGYSAGVRLSGDIADTVRLKQDVQAVVGVYKARSLEGIWATPPFLHNGSVPSLYQLLLPAEQRVSVFPVGSQAFDPVSVGIDMEATDFTSVFDTAILGNSNAGHEFGTDLDELSRLSLIEFLKSL